MALTPGERSWLIERHKHVAERIAYAERMLRIYQAEAKSIDDKLTADEEDESWLYE